jgi:hypothetical protein
MTGKMENDGKKRLAEKTKFISRINVICPVKPGARKYSAFPK